MSGKMYFFRGSGKIIFDGDGIDFALVYAGSVATCYRDPTEFQYVTILDKIGDFY